MNIKNEYEMNIKWIYGNCINVIVLNLRVFTIFITYLIYKISL